MNFTSRWSEPARFAILPMVVKQGLAVTDAGRGELNAAFEGLTSVTQVCQNSLAR